jgi:uncharacterized protein
MDQALANRLAVLTRLVKKSPTQDLGRTAIMKLAYFLTTVRDVPLGYRFTLYSYGPFDSSVLQDVDVASNLGALRSQPMSYPTGVGYSIQPANRSEEVESLAKEFLDEHEDDINWVIEEFGKLTATELELASTIVYIDRESSGAIAPPELARRVHDVKPHFSIDRILGCAEALKNKHLLTV